MAIPSLDRTSGSTPRVRSFTAKSRSHNRHDRHQRSDRRANTRCNVGRSQARRRTSPRSGQGVGSTETERQALERVAGFGLMIGTFATNSIPCCVFASKSVAFWHHRRDLRGRVRRTNSVQTESLDHEQNDHLLALRNHASSPDSITIRPINLPSGRLLLGRGSLLIAVASGCSRTSAAGDRSHRGLFVRSAADHDHAGVARIGRRRLRLHFQELRQTSGCGLCWPQVSLARTRILRTSRAAGVPRASAGTATANHPASRAAMNQSYPVRIAMATAKMVHVLSCWVMQ